MILNAALSKPRPHRYVSLPSAGFISLVTLMDGTPLLDVGRGSREGMVGAEAVSSVFCRKFDDSNFQWIGQGSKICLVLFCDSLRPLLENFIGECLELIGERLLAERNGMLAPC